ncbi:MAG: hypothetical protein HY553_06410, partial [Elusimicrobia bacterium]|nr:hypothetical protein [Elusimicrobiota bacterium]
MSGKGVLGWLILAVALAVPAFMFWNWWKLLNNKPVEFGRKPVQGPVFNDTKMASQMPNPLAGSTATASGQPPAAVPQGSAAAPAQPPAAQAAPQPPAAPAPGTPPADPPAPAAQPGAPAPPAAAGAATPE